MSKKLIKTENLKAKAKSSQADIITDDPKPLTDKSNGSIAAGNEMHSLAPFFEWTVTRPDGAIQSMQVKISGHLQRKRKHMDIVREAHLVLLAMQSSRLGHPISILLDPEDRQVAVQMLDACMEMTPGDSVCEFQNLKPEQLFNNGGGQLSSKCLVSLIPNGFARVSQDIDSIMTRGYAVRQDIVRGKFDVTLKQHRINMSLSIVGIDEGNAGNKLNHPSIMKVPLRTGHRSFQGTPVPIVSETELLQSPIFKIKKSLERVRYRPVIIPYENQLAEAIESSGCHHPDIKLGVLKNVISLLTIINQPPPVTRAEVGSIIYQTHEAEVLKWLAQAGIENSSTGPAGDDPLTATKIEYYMTNLLLDGLLMTGGMYLTERQKKIFETVATINLGKLSGVIMKKNDDIEKMATIARSSSCWAKRDKVFELLNKNSSDFYSLSTISNELVELCNMGLLERGKPPKQHFFGYFITTLYPNGMLNLPDPSLIKDPVYRGKTIKVVNPITGQVEKV